MTCKMTFKLLIGCLFLVAVGSSAYANTQYNKVIIKIKNESGITLYCKFGEGSNLQFSKDCDPLKTKSGTQVCATDYVSSSDKITSGTVECHTVNKKDGETMTRVAYKFGGASSSTKSCSENTDKIKSGSYKPGYSSADITKSVDEDGTLTCKYYQKH